MSAGTSRSPRRPGQWLLSVAVVVAVATTLACAATRERRGAVEASGFLGNLYPLLEKNPDFTQKEIWVKPGVDWSQYDSIRVAAVTIWRNEGTSEIDPGERQAIADTCWQKFHARAKERFTIVTEPSPQALIVRIALTEAKGAPVALRTVSTVIPQVRLVSMISGLSADTATTVGAATMEGMIVDSVTAERLAATVDERAGNKALFSARSYEKWGDVEAICDFWGESLRDGLLRIGVRPKN